MKLTLLLLFTYIGALFLKDEYIFRKIWREYFWKKRWYELFVLNRMRIFLGKSRLAELGWMPPTKELI